MWKLPSKNGLFFEGRIQMLTFGPKFTSIALFLFSLDLVFQKKKSSLNSPVLISQIFVIMKNWSICCFHVIYVYSKMNKDATQKYFIITYISLDINSKSVGVHPIVQPEIDFLTRE